MIVEVSSVLTTFNVDQIPVKLFHISSHSAVYADRFLLSADLIQCCSYHHGNLHVWIKLSYQSIDKSLNLS